MSFMFVTPESLTAAAAQLNGVGSALNEANASASAAITRVFAAGQDEVSAAITAAFNQYGQSYQGLSAQVAQFHSQFVQATRLAAEQYQAMEADLFALLAARQAGRVGFEGVDPDRHTNPAGGGG
ncbi:PE family protein [Mycobacterium spongiae]|uniref:PE domain-containing protein n=1 Tax=Mycobacterium spongiae TaxID=886343 RepID=A0A975K058_9MYCO|nr:PE family protein [Mycobacterium spongiae]QUR68934.1 PE domain-containing protein [Mycobacterium spongiae]